MNERLGSVQDATSVRTLDCSQGYLHIPVAAEDKPKMIFRYHRESYALRGMPFRRITASAAFQSVLGMPLTLFRRRNSLIYLNDIILFSNDANTNTEYVKDI